MSTLKLEEIYRESADRPHTHVLLFFGTNLPFALGDTGREYSGVREGDLM
jgi:hypothetical protein